VEYEDFFKSLDCNIIVYDQRTCGRSTEFFKDPGKVVHAYNINELQEIYYYLTEKAGIKIKGLVGHSYGAKLLFDFLKKSKLYIPSVFVSTADSILTPRLNNLISDLGYLKKVDAEKYQEITAKMNKIDLKTIWKLTEELAPFFQENKDRQYLYWANLATFERIRKIQKKIGLPNNPGTFMSVRQDLYSNEDNFSVDIDSLEVPHLWINGFQDSVMGDPVNGLSGKGQVILFYRSSHYPHIEENERFCEMMNAFLCGEDRAFNRFWLKSEASDAFCFFCFFMEISNMY
jgi:proline iminopeptidase